jgi:hypothetical protein
MLVLVFLLATPAARAEEQTSSLGGVTATLSFEVDDYVYSDLWLTITRNGETLLDDEPTSKDCFEVCFPGGGTNRESVHVRDLDGDGEPEVLVDLYSGGAHCCVIGRVYAYNGVNGYRQTTRNFADPGYRLVDVDADGIPELISADARFAYRFTSFAGSIFPVRIWSYYDGTFFDVTDEHPDRIRADVRRSWKLYRRALRKDWEPRGAIAAWAANKYRLGQRKSALRVMRRLARRHQLPGYSGLGKRSQTAFVSDLDGFLRRLGYAK